MPGKFWFVKMGTVKVVKMVSSCWSAKEDDRKDYLSFQKKGVEEANILQQIL